MRLSLIRSAKPLAAAALITLSGCTLGPDFSPPKAPDVSAFTAANDTAAKAPSRADVAPQSIVYGGAVADDWYHLFASARLDGLVRDALANNPDLKAAQAGIAAAQAQFRAVAGDEYPQLDLSAGATRGKANGSLLYQPAPSFQGIANTFSLTPTLSYDLDVFGGISRSVEAQAANTDYVRAQALDTYVTLVNQVVATAFELAASQARINATNDLVQLENDQLKIVRAQENAGTITHADTLQAQAQLEATEATLPALIQQKSAAAHALAALTGKMPAEFEAPDFTLTDFILPEKIPATLPSTLVQQRPDILMAQATLHEASARVGIATAARLPSISLSASYGVQATKTTDVFTPSGVIWSFGASLLAPIFDGGTLEANEDAAKAQYVQSGQLYRKTVLNAFADVATAMKAIENDAAAASLRRQSLQTADASRKLATEQFNAGSTDYLNVLTADRQYQAALLDDIDISEQRFANTTQLVRALGGGWWSAEKNPATALNISDASIPVTGARQ
ncbi:MAG: efflux transporter outer membrane subunit [Parvibaculaceae bacterium]|nr:efflux transporter outer membrane subunit [Parvibaculaceae bacterium]